MQVHKCLALAAVLVLAACGGKKSGQVTVSAAGGTGSMSGGTPTQRAPAALPEGLHVTEVNVAVRELELEDGPCAGSGSGSSSLSRSPGSSSSSDDSDDECEAELGPFIAHLDEAALASVAAGELPMVWIGTLPAGTYSELEVKLCPVDPGSLADPDQAALAAAMDGATVVVKGSYQPAGATSATGFTVAVTACTEIERHVSLTVDDQGAISNLTVNLDLGAWFRDSAGMPIDPTHAEGAAAIAANIAAALDVYGDDDRDGSCDDE